jgi:ribonuclease HI
MLKIYTDGACSGNPGPGGWAYVIPEYTKEEFDYAPATTNNRMELIAVIEGLHGALKYANGGDVEIITDSQYVVNTMTLGWKKNKNVDLWQELDNILVYFHEVKWTWIKGHADNPYNKRCDELAVNAYKTYEKAKWEKEAEKLHEEQHRYDDCYDTEIPLTVTSPQLAVGIALTAHKRYMIDGHTYTILDCAALPGLYVIEKDYCALIYHGSFDDCMFELRNIKDPDILPF